MIDPIIEKLLLILAALAASQGFWSFFGSRLTKAGKTERAVKGLLHDLLLVQKHISAGQISPEAYRVVNELFESYIELGGNGNIARMMNAVKDLKIEVREHEE